MSISRTAVVAAVVAAVVGLAGCSVPRGGNSAMNEVAGCAAVLPLARDTVHAHGQLVLVHSLGRKDADDLYREIGAPPLPKPTPPSGQPPPPPDPAAGAPLPKTCIVVYQGTFAAGSVTGADADASGAYALIVLRVRHPIVYRVLLTPTLPQNLPGT